MLLVQIMPDSTRHVMSLDFILELWGVIKEFQGEKWHYEICGF